VLRDSFTERIRVDVLSVCGSREGVVTASAKVVHVHSVLVRVPMFSMVTVTTSRRKGSDLRPGRLRRCASEHDIAGFEVRNELIRANSSGR